MLNFAPMNQNEILERLGVGELSLMQREAQRAILGGRSDVIILSPTGSGKTLAYLLPLVQLVNAGSEDVQVLVVVPGRELAMQSDTVLRSMKSGVRSAACYGGRAAMDEHRQLRKLLPHVVFGTPGRLNDHLDKGNISARTVRYVVIDEFDKCLAMGFYAEMTQLMSRLTAASRRILLSATDAQEIPAFVQMARAARLDYLDQTEQVSDRVRLYEVKSPDKDKLQTLLRLLCQQGDGQSIVFLNYRDSVERVDGYLREKGFATSALHGGMDQKQRESELYKFFNGSANVLVATDLASRGLDIPDVSNIIHYHLPLAEENYVHRVGRTARWEQSGVSFFLIGPEEHVPAYVEGQVEPFALPAEMPPVPKPRMATVYIGKGKKDKISKGDIVGFLCKKGGLSPADIGHIAVSDRYAYVAVARESVASMLSAVRDEKIKGLKTIIEPVK